MNKVEWGAMEVRDRDALIAERLLGYSWVVLGCAPFESMETDIGKRFLCDVFSIDAYQKANGNEEKSSEWDRFFSNYTTDRNACALVVDEIEERDREFVFAKILADELNIRATGGWNDFAISIRLVLSADPDLICYCAIKAIEESTT